MVQALLFLTVFVILARLWSRLQLLEQRLSATEGAAPAVVAAEPLRSPARIVRSPWSDRVDGAVAEPLVQAGETIVAEPEAQDEREVEVAPEIEAGAEPVPQPEPQPEPELSLEPALESDSGFEDLFGRKLPIWAGGVTLAVAGVLIVRYSIEAGLLSPLIRVIAGMIFGTLLIAAAELALRFEQRVRDPRVRQALSGAGIASLYASILVATNLYALIGPLTALVGMAAITALAVGLSPRFGAPSALLGLVGGLAAPALVGAGEPNIPLLTCYLALAVGGLTLLSRAQRWIWLGASALAGGLGWGAVLLLGGALDIAASLSVGFYLILVGIAFPLLALPMHASTLIRLGGSVVATAQMAALVATGGFSLLHWALFGLISAAVVWLARRETAFEQLPAVGLGLVLLLIGAWPDPTPGGLGVVILVATAIYGGNALYALWRPGGRIVQVGEIAALSLGATVLAAMHFYRADHSVDLPLAAVALAAAGFPAVAAALGWSRTERREDPRFALLVSNAAVLLVSAAAFAVPITILPLALAALGVALILLSLAADDARLEVGAGIVLVLSLALLTGAASFEHEFVSLFGIPGDSATGLSILRWGGLAAACAVFARHSRLEIGRDVAQGAVAVLGYGAVAQIVPASWLALVSPMALLTVAVAARRSGGLLPAMAVLFFVSAAWAASPLLGWGSAALLSLGGDPLLVVDLPSVRDAILRLLVPSLLIAGGAAISWQRLHERHRLATAAVAAAAGAVGGHILFKQIVGIASTNDFIAYGLLERTLWQMLLLAAAAGTWRVQKRSAAGVLALASVGHLAWYSLLIHNPLWALQAVGDLPLINLLLGIYAAPLVLLTLVPRWQVDRAARFDRPRAAIQMLLITLLAYSTLRQLAHGSILVEPGLSPAEDIARSIVAVALAIGFLLWGLRRRSRDWRIGSLVLMLLAVAKVFLLDASGLEGLTRIGSFVALGISLIGIGWLYSRALSPSQTR